MRDKNGEELKKSGKVMKRKNVEINRKKVSEWFTEKFFGKEMSSWDQLMEYVFGNKSRKEILDAMDTPREMIRRRLDNGCILPGYNRKKGMVVNSRAALQHLMFEMTAAQERGEQVWITIS